MTANEPGAPRIELRDACVTLAGRAVLRDVTLSIRAGEIATIEGASGSGKSTLLRALALFVQLERGSLSLDGRPALSMEPAQYRRRVAHVAQTAVMFGGTVADNLRVGPGLRGASLAPGDVWRLLEGVGLDAKLAEKEAKDLSGGERQRVALARALANEPDVLLLDEPTASLDPAAAQRVLALVRDLAGRGLAVAVVTHDPSHALALRATRYRVEGATLEALGQ